MKSVLAIENVSKTFGPVKALQQIHLEVFPGEIHAVIGENGAGKSTLMKILSGAYQPDPGASMHLGGIPYSPANPAQGRRAGIAMIYQELNLAPHLTVEENIFLGIERSRWGWVQPQKKEVGEILTWLGYPDLSPHTRVGALPIGQQQVVEIARALASDARLVIMDEPTSSLSGEDSKTLFNIIRRLKKRGIAVLYISHFLEEVKEIADRFTVLRDGEWITTGPVAEATIPEMIGHMVGRSVDELYPDIPHAIGEVILEIEELFGEHSPNGLSLSLRKGEILGIAGLVGAGRSETLRAIFGLERAKAGTLKLSGHPKLELRWIKPATALKMGMDFLSENRKEEGLALNMSIASNITLSSLRNYSRRGFLQLKEEKATAKEYIEKLQLKCRDANQEISDLSGGNQQKASFARLLHQDGDIFFLDEPTRGIDVGSKAELYRIILQLAANGKSVVMVSSYLPELFGVCDTLAVMHRGKLSPVRPVDEWEESTVMLYATSGKLEISD